MKVILTVISLAHINLVSAQNTVDKVYDLSNVSSVVVVKEVKQDNSSERIFTPLKVKFSVKKDVDDICSLIGDSAKEDPGSSPFTIVGDFCHLILYNRDSSIAALVTLVNYNSVCELREAKVNAKGHITVSHAKNILGFQSEKLVMKIYTRLVKDDPEYVKQVDKSIGDLVLKEVLFGKNQESNK